MNEKNEHGRSAQPAIECRELSKRYGELFALRSLDLSVGPGSIFGFLGRNGAGKTTTIRLLTGLAHPTAGKAWVNGVETTRADSSARTQFGYLPQDPAFYGWMSPMDYLDYVGRLFQMDAAERKSRSMELLKLVGLERASNRRIGGFSGGMVQRLGIAQALIHGPEVLFLDEPTSSLDPAGRYDVLELIDRLRGQVTVFLSSHILADIERVCDTVAIIHEGELLLVAGREELLSRYATNTVLIELEQESRAMGDRLLKALSRMPWAGSGKLDDGVLRLTVTDEMAAKKAMLPFLANSGAVVNRLEWVRPSLEEVFLALSD
jgi:ABC-2 type transport system ATP-binding protein